MKKVFFILFALVVNIFLLLRCNSNANTNSAEKQDSLQIKGAMESPSLSPEESLKSIKTDEGFTVQLVAAEPMVTAPVAFIFDEKNRLWVAEMMGYMTDTVGTGEEEPSGKIVILADTNGDGKMDNRTVFLDSLVLPRALCFYQNGLLVASTPNLWFYEIENDKPNKRTLVDSNYTVGGNVEHEPNGLLRAMDNWIYNAKFDKRYRKVGDKWKIEQTHFRGQWGITQDNYGRLFYNNNSMNLLGDYFSPGLGAGNENQKITAGFNEKIVEDNRVYPIAPTPGVNRGYMEGILDDSLRLVNFTAACSPYIYRGHLFGNAFVGNAFVAEPAGNLIKRNLLEEHGNKVQGKQAYKEKEFIASTDERFRPVFLSEGPDGALYVADMYRGIIQHKVYLTDYLKSEIKTRELTQPLNCGRIYRIIPKNKRPATTTISTDPQQLAALLQHPSGWVRDKAQQLIIDHQYKGLDTTLRKFIQQRDNPLTVIHALWTLEGLGLLQTDDLMPLLQQNNWTLKRQALSAITAVINHTNYQQYLSVLQQLLNSNDTLAAPYVAFLTTEIKRFNPSAANALLFDVAKKYSHNTYVADAVISNLKNEEQSFYKKFIAINKDTALALTKGLKKVIDNKESSGRSNKELQKKYPRGYEIYTSVCQSCHGKDGNGIRLLAPPLNKSEWVNESKSRLIAIVLYGLSGPIQVNQKIYKAPEISGETPGIGHNKSFSDEDIAQLLSFVRKSWSNKGDEVKAADVQKVRQQLKNREKAFTAEELKKIK